MAAVSGHQAVGVGGDDALQDAVVGVATRDDLRQAGRLNDGGGVLKGAYRPYRPFLVPAEFPRQHPGDLAQDEPGQEQLEPAPQGQLQYHPLVAGEVQAGDDHVGV